MAQEAGERVGTHSLGTTAGAAGGAVAGAVSGLVAGPLGSLVGAVGGAALGGGTAALTGSGSGAEFDISAEEAYWRTHHDACASAANGADYAEYQPAYRYGIESYLRTDHPQTGEEVESDLAEGWESARGQSRLNWDDAKPAVRQAWERMYNGPDAKESAP